MKKIPIVDCLVAAGAAAAFFAVVVPVQTYLSNRDGFAFPVSRLSLELALAFVVLVVAGFAVLAVLSLVMPRKRFKWLWAVPFAIVFALMLCGYLETGILAANLPQLDGDLGGLGNAYRKVVDTLVLACGFVGGFFATMLLRGHIRLIFGGLFVMTVASLFDVRSSATAKTASEMGEGFCPKYTVAASMEYSTNRNVLVFILDSLPASICTDVIAANPELAAKFPGFVCFRDNIGMHECTQRGLPGLMTGIYASKDQTADEYALTMFGADSILYPYFKEGLPAFFVGAMYEFGYCNRQKNTGSSRQAGQNSRWAVLRRFGGTPNLSLWDVVKFRLAPFVMKHGIMCAAIAEGNAYAAVNKEATLYPMLAESSVGDAAQVFALYHTRGIHVPNFIGKGGVRFPDDMPERDRLESAAYYVLDLLGDLFARLMERGIYDKSSIIVTTDHGIIHMECPEGEMGQTSAALMVKPEGANGPFAVSDVPTSHSHIASLVKKLHNAPLRFSEMETTLRQDVRLYRGRFKKSVMFYDWTYGPDGKLIKREEAGIFKGQ